MTLILGILYSRPWLDRSIDANSQHVDSVQNFHPQSKDVKFETERNDSILTDSLTLPFVSTVHSFTH